MTPAVKHQCQPLPKVKQFSKFVFIGDSQLVHSPIPLEKDRRGKVLNQMNLGDILKIVRIDAEESIVRQLADLQFKSGKIVRIVDKTVRNSAIVDLDGNLIGICSNIASTIVVTSISSVKS